MKFGPGGRRPVQGCFRSASGLVGILAPERQTTEGASGPPSNFSFLLQNRLAMLRAVSSCVSRVAGRYPSQRSARAALAAQGSRADTQTFQKLPFDSTYPDQQSSSSYEKRAAWYPVRWQLGATAAATAGLIGSSRCADDDEDEGEDQVTHLPLQPSLSKSIPDCSPSWHAGMIIYSEGQRAL